MTENERMRTFLLNRIFEELKQANVNRYYAEELIDRQIVSSKWFNVLVSLFSTTGAVGAAMNIWVHDFPILLTWLPLFSATFVALISIANQFYPIFFLKTEDLTKLINLHTSYLIYFNRLQDLFCLADSNEVDKIEAQIRFNKLIEDNSMRVTDISRIFGKINKRIEKKATDKSDKYLESIYKL